VRGVVGQGLDDAFGGRWIEVFQGGQVFNFSCNVLGMDSALMRAWGYMNFLILAAIRSNSSASEASRILCEACPSHSGMMWA
jgi:hypothetical protein